MGLSCTLLPHPMCRLMWPARAEAHWLRLASRRRPGGVSAPVQEKVGSGLAPMYSAESCVVPRTMAGEVPPDVIELSHTLPAMLPRS